MSWQPPDTDPPAAPEPDTETARVPWEAPPVTPSQPGANGPSVLWAAPAPTVQVEVPGAPNLVFSDTFSRFVAYLIDAFVMAIASLIISTLIAGGRATTIDAATVNIVFAVMFTVVSFAYSVFFWTGGRRATPGQMLFKIQVGNAFDGRPLTATQATKRWLGLGWFLTLFGIVPLLASLANLADFVWLIILLVTTVQSPTKQGLHDRFANSAVVRPRDASRSGLAMACLVIVLMVLAVSVLSMVALIVLGDQVKDILEKAGNSV